MAFTDVGIPPSQPPTSSSFFQRLATRFLNASRHPAFPILIALIFMGIASDRSIRKGIGFFYESSEIRMGVFALVVVLTFAFSKHALARVGFCTLLLAFMLMGAVKFGEKFPFESWRLYSKPAQAARTVCFIDVVTESGKSYRIDERAMGDFTTPTNHNRWGERVNSDMSRDQQIAFAKFVAKRIEHYREDRRAERSGWRMWARKLKFPAHQISASWSDQDLENVKDVAAIRIRVETIRLDEKNQWKPQVIDQKVMEVPCR